MSNVQIQQEQWNKIVEFLHQQPHVYVGNKKECRRFVTAVLGYDYFGLARKSPIV